MKQFESNSIHSLQDHPFRNYQGGYFKTLISPEQSGGSLAILDLTLPAGAEPPPHIHTLEDETFYVLDGELQLRVGDTLVLLKAGEAVFAPRNVPHSFKILTDSARFINLITPGTLWAYFMAFSEPCEVEPKIKQLLQPPPPEHIQSMLSVLTNLYQLKFI